MSQCEHCKKVLYTKEMPTPIKREYEILKSKAKGPIWQFTGLAILIVMVIWAFISVKLNS